MNNKIKDFIKEQFEKLKDLSARERNKQIVAGVKKKFREVINGSDIYELCGRIDKLKDKIQKVNESLDDKPPYEVTNGKYIFHRKDKEPFEFTIDEIDQLFKEYPKLGKDMSKRRIKEKYNMTEAAWNCIRSRLELYKDSNTVSPYAAKTLPPEELQERIEESIDNHIDSIKSKMISTHEKRFKEEAKKAFKILGNIEYFLDNLREYIIDYKPMVVDYVKQPVLNNDRLEIAFSDIHFGKNGTKDIVARFDEIYNYIVNRNESYINIICLGDLGESFAPGGMHPGQVEHMEMHWFELMMFIVHTFEKFLVGLEKKWKVVTFRGIGGNHDRIWQNNNQDTQRTAALCIYEMIKRGLSRTEIDINYFIDKINTFQIGELNYIIHH